MTAGIYIVVEEEQPDGPGDTDDTDGGYIRPEVPKTGDESAAWLYLALIFLGGAGLALLIFGGRRDKNNE